MRDLGLFEKSVSDGCASKSESGDDADIRAASKKNYELCVGAANHIASIGRSATLRNMNAMMLSCLTDSGLLPRKILPSTSARLSLFLRVHCEHHACHDA